MKVERGPYGETIWEYDDFNDVWVKTQDPNTLIGRMVMKSEKHEKKEVWCLKNEKMDRYDQIQEDVWICVLEEGYILRPKGLAVRMMENIKKERDELYELNKNQREQLQPTKNELVRFQNAYMLIESENDDLEEQYKILKDKYKYLKLKYKMVKNG